jgi:hypothetical protein
VRAGDHQHGDGALDGVLRVAQSHPGDESDQPGACGEVKEQGCRPVGQRLGPGPGLLGLLDEAADPGESGPFPDGADPDPQRRIGGYGAGNHPVARALGDSPGLAGDHRFVDVGLAVSHHAVSGHPPARADQHQVAGGQFVEPDRLDGTVGTDPLGRVGQQGRQSVQGAGGLPEGPHL